jgi:transcriptional regulator with XRE-family HTH domain
VLTVPRRKTPDPFSRLVGARIRQLRVAAGLTSEKLAFESELGSKGHLSDIEHGRTRPNVRTLKVLADRLGVAVLDLVTFPDQDERQRLIDRTRSLTAPEVARLLRDLDGGKRGGGRRNGR